MYLLNNNMAKSAQIGEIRTWSNGRKYQKTANGWVPVKSGSKGNSEQKEEPAKGKSSKGSESSKQDYQIKQGTWNENIPVDKLPYAQKSVSYLKEKFPDLKVSAYIDDENEDYEVQVSIPSKDGKDIDVHLYGDIGDAVLSYEDKEKDVDIYDEDSLEGALEEFGYYSENGNETGDAEAGSKKNSKEKDLQEYVNRYTHHSKSIRETAYDKDVKNLKKEIFDNIKPGATIMGYIGVSKVDGFDEDSGEVSFTGMNGKKYSAPAEYFATDEQLNQFRVMAKAARQTEAFGKYDAYPRLPVSGIEYKESSAGLDQSSENKPDEGDKNNSSNEKNSYSPEQLADYAKSASDEGLKRAASSGDEQMRIAAKKEIARRKNEGMENDTDNPFDKGSIRKSQREERIYKGQVYEKIDGGWIKKK